jgi:hypothetical protein
MTLLSLLRGLYLSLLILYLLSLYSQSRSRLSRQAKRDEGDPLKPGRVSGGWLQGIARRDYSALRSARGRGGGAIGEGPRLVGSRLRGPSSC